MHKCLKCGQEYEGNFCPNCGAGNQDKKTCPKCGSALAGNSNFCNVCGYSFEGKPSGAKKKSVGGWIKSHLKIVIPATALLLVAIILLAMIPTFKAMGTNGTYYKANSKGETDKETYFILKGNTWTNE